MDVRSFNSNDRSGSNSENRAIGECLGLSDDEMMNGEVIIMLVLGFQSDSIR